jgi:DNA-binding MarR family transcriptional regulator
MEIALSSNASALHERFEALLVEVNGLANRLKATDPRVAIPCASRAALQVLQKHGPQTVPQIARARFSSRQNIQILMNRLKDEGLVEFVSNPDHKRSALVSLTPRGQAAIAQATAEEAKLSIELLPAFSPMELSSATEVLNRLRTLLDGREKAQSPAKGAEGIREHTEDNPIENQLADSLPAQKRGDEKVPNSTDSESLIEGELPVSLL